MRKTYFQPNAISAQKLKWRSDSLVRAIGLLTCHGGAMSGKALAVLLGVSPRGLRRAFQSAAVIQPEIRTCQDDRSKDETWYRLNLAAINRMKLDYQITA